MSRFFVGRPIVAMVIAILMVIAGAVAMIGLPVAQYPDIVPPQIQVSAVLGRFLQVQARAIGARRILEIGTLAGYSAIWLARALPADGRRHVPALRAMLAQHVGRAEAQRLAQDVSHRVARDGTDLRRAALGDARVRDLLDPDTIESALDPLRYLGSTDTFINRALSAFEKEIGPHAAA